MLYYVIKIIFYITKKLFSYKIILILIINLINKNELKKILTNYINIFNKFNYILYKHIYVYSICNNFK